MDNLEEIVKLFPCLGKAVEIKRFGSGHINETYRVTNDEGRHFILQKIATSIFKDPDGMMENIRRVTEHIRAKGFETLEVLAYVRPWRVYSFIENSKSYDVLESADQAYAVAKAFADFQNMLADLPPPRLNEILPKFHNTVDRLRLLDEAAKADVKGRRASVAEELAFIDARREQAGRIVAGLEDGSIPERITHNDTKINNILLDAVTGKARAVIDLDTVMPGCALYDFGDMVRTSSANALEDEKDLSKVYSRPEYFEALVKGYMEEAKFLTDNEVKNLAFSGRLITLTIGIRFLTDYLAGDTYFHTDYPDHNLVRARTQFKMVKSMEDQEELYESIVRKYRG